MSQHLGILGFITEASEIQRELGVSAEEAWHIHGERVDARMRELEAAEQAAAESNVIPFRAKH